MPAVDNWRVLGGDFLDSFSVMDTLNTLLLGWLVTALLILLSAKFFYDKFLRGDEESLPSDSGYGGESSASDGKVEEKRRVPVIVPQADCVRGGSVPVASGQDVDAVKWINEVMQWIYNPSGGGKMTKLFLDLLNDLTVKTALETGVLVEVLEVLQATKAPHISNMVVDCYPMDEMNVTCDYKASVFLRLQITRTQGDKTSESEYAVAVDPLVGRLNVDLKAQQLQATVKFDGWPEVPIELEGIRNNEEGLGEKELQEVIKDVLSSAIRSLVLKLDLQDDSSFPRLKRSRDLPEKVMPVGYDSMIREKQTHPPILKPKQIPSVSLRDAKVNGDLVSGIPSSTINHIIAPEKSKNMNYSGKGFVERKSEPPSRQLEFDDDMGYDHFERRRSQPEVIDQRVSWDKGYIPPGFLEQVTAVALAKVSEKSLSNMKGSSQEQDDNVSESASEITSDIHLSDYIPYDSEYEEDEDVYDYLEGKQAPKKEPVLLSPFERLPVTPIKIESNIPEDTFSNKPVTNSHPIGAMGLPHHPKSHFAQTLVPAPPPPGLAILNGKRLLVKIVKATGVACEKSFVDGYVVVEMDEPAQKFQTAVIEGSNSPLWNEQFLFDLSDSTLELLFEVYDERDSSFLGLGIVGIEELVATPSQRQIIPLQARPYEDDVVSGSLTVEFLFLEGGDLPELSSRKLASVQTSNGVTNTTTYIRNNNHIPPTNGESIADAALRDLSDSSVTTQAPNKSTLIIHAAKKADEETEEQTTETDDRENYPYPVDAPPTKATPATTIFTSTTPAFNPPLTTGGSGVLNETLDEPSVIEDDDRGRSRKKRGSFFGSLKKRFSRSKQRSKSVQPNATVPLRESTPTDAPRTATVGRSVSIERSQRLRPTGLLSVPKSNTREFSGPSDTGSTRSSLSETSGLSSSSTRTYVNEASMLIVETVENGVIKHYLVPISMQQRNKWRKRGTKLHVYAGHIFVAKHISSSLKCSVCSKNFNRRPGKQGYECRDCGAICHKPCHMRTEIQCPNSKVNTMDLTPLPELV